MDNIRKTKSRGMDIYSVNFADYLPEILKYDPKMKAFAAAVTEQMLGVSAEIDNVLIYSKINELPEELIDILAYDMHVDWYDYSYPLEKKRDILRGSVKIHKTLGTKYAIETALCTMYPDTKIEEWFNYGGNPFCFRIRLNGDYNSAINIVDILKKILIYKRASAHLDTICITYCIKIIIDYKNAVRARTKFWPRQNLEYLYLDGTRKLNGNQKLDGRDINTKIDLYPVHSIAEIHVPVPINVEQGGNTARVLAAVNKSYLQFVNARIRFWPRQNLEYLYLDGRRRLDGSRKLNGYNTIANINLYPMYSIARIHTPVPIDVKQGGNTTRVLAAVNKSYLQSVNTRIRFWSQQNYKNLHKIYFPVEICAPEQNTSNIKGTVSMTATIDTSYIDSTTIRIQTNKKDMQYKMTGTPKNEVKMTVCTKKAHVKIHGCLDGTRKLTGSRKLNAGKYEL